MCMKKLTFRNAVAENIFVITKFMTIEPISFFVWAIKLENFYSLIYEAIYGLSCD